MEKKNIPAIAYIRFCQTMPIPFSCDLYVDDLLQVSDLLYEDFTEYMSLTPGTHSFYVTRHKDPTPLYSRKLNLYNHRIYTCVLAPSPKNKNDFFLYHLEDVARPIPNNHFLLRIGHFASSSTPLDICLSSDMPRFKKLTSNELSSYLAVEPGTYTIEIKDHTNDNLLLSLPNVQFKTSRFYSIYIIGGENKTFPLTISRLVDGNSYLDI